MSEQRDSAAAFTFALLAIGAFLLGASYGWRTGVGVLAVVWSIGGEVQRKANQILDELERKR